MKNQHTPGPWIVRGGNVIENEAGVNVAKAWMTDCEEECANSNLIAASPDLLSALKALHSCHRAFSQNENWTTLDDEARRFAEAAIAKAEGN